jgi:hypothetical protein
MVKAVLQTEINPLLDVIFSILAIHVKIRAQRVQFCERLAKAGHYFRGFVKLTLQLLLKIQNFCIDRIDVIHIVVIPKVKLFLIGTYLQQQTPIIRF